MNLFKRRGASPKPHRFSEEQIQQKAYELWKARGEASGSSENDWQQAIAALQHERSLPGRVQQPFKVIGQAIRQTWQGAWNQENRAFSLDVLKTAVSIFGVLASVTAGVGLYLTYQNAQQERQLNPERLITDRFGKAVEQLGSKDISVRIGGIYSLERIAKDSPKDHWTVIEVLTAYVREKSPLPKVSEAKGSQPKNSKQPTPLANSPKFPTDVQSALTAIGRRDPSRGGEGKRLDLSNSYLSYANLSGANLSGANLYGAHLNSAYFIDANLNGANLNGAYLNDAYLNGASLSSASLSGAYLNGTNLNGADLSGVVLNGVDLSGVVFYGADFSNANLYDADLSDIDLSDVDLSGAWNLTAKQLEGTKLCKTQLPKEIMLNPDRDCPK